MYKPATIRALIAVAIVAVPGIGVSVQAAGAKPVDPDSVVVPKLRSPNEPSAVNFSAPAAAQFLRTPGTNRYRVKSLHGGLDD